MIRLTLTSSLPLAILMLCGSASRIEASGDTPITVKDGSIVLIPGGLDSGKNWSVTSQLRHLNGAGVLSSLKVTEAGADRCGGQPMCGVDPSRQWTIQVNYGPGSVTIASVSGGKGVRIKFSGNLPFAKWQKTANADEREYGHGDGLHITGIAVNNGPNLCPGKNGCEVDLIYRAP